jgi:calcium-dependent protein kinase
MSEINYEYEDFSSFILGNKMFRNRFNLISIVKNGNTKASFIVSDNTDDKIYFLKAKLYDKLTSYELEVYQLLKNNQHSNIVKIYDVLVEDKFYLVLKEYINGVNLAEYKCGKTASSLSNIINQISSGLNHIHSLDIIHGDIKLENIMIYNTKIKIVDFDLARIAKTKYIFSEYIYGTENYIAPESFDMNVYSKNADLWAFGILLYKLVTGKFPYKYKLDRMHHFYIKNNFKDLNIDELYKYKNVYGIENINLIKGLLEFDDCKRMNNISKIIHDYSNL